MVEKNKHYLIKLPGEISWTMAIYWRVSSGFWFKLTGNNMVIHESVIKERRKLW